MHGVLKAVWAAARTCASRGTSWGMRGLCRVAVARARHSSRVCAGPVGPAIRFTGASNAGEAASGACMARLLFMCANTLGMHLHDFVLV